VEDYSLAGSNSRKLLSNAANGNGRFLCIMYDYTLSSYLQDSSDYSPARIVLSEVQRDHQYDMRLDHVDCLSFGYEIGMETKVDGAFLAECATWRFGDNLFSKVGGAL
jgi:hypothetical protein